MPPEDEFRLQHWSSRRIRRSGSSRAATALISTTTGSASCADEAGGATHRATPACRSSPSGDCLAGDGGSSPCGHIFQRFVPN